MFDKLSINKKVRSELTSTWEKVLKEKKDNYHSSIITIPRTIQPIRLRPSRFPICSVLTFLDKIDEQITGPKQNDSTLMDFFTSVGSTVHAVVQKWMGYTGRMVGNWKCPNCEHLEKLTTFKTCPTCHRDMVYEELTVKYKNLSGHVDGVFVLDSGKYIVVDYKTSSTRKIEEAKFDNIGYKLQVLSYAYILRTKYKLPIVGASLLYIGRDNPFSYFEKHFKITEVNLPKIKNFLHKQIDRYNAADQGLANQDVSIPIDHKPCFSRDDYYANMHVYDTCPLLDICFTRSLAGHLSNKLKKVSKS